MLTEVREWSCPDCEYVWEAPNINDVPGHCPNPACGVTFTPEKKPRPGGLKPVRPPFEG